MSILEDKSVKRCNIDFSRVYNKNEKRVQKQINVFVEEHDPRIEHFSEKDFQDVYALALNSIRPRYVHQGTIVLREIVGNEELLIAIDDAISTIANRPKE